MNSTDILKDKVIQFAWFDIIYCICAGFLAISNKVRITIIIFLSILICITSSYAQYTNLDWKWHDVGKVRQLITNVGYTGNTHVLNIGTPAIRYCEYPLGSDNWYTRWAPGGGGIWVGAERGGGTILVSTASHEPNYDFFPSAADWDTIWVVGRDEMIDIPYWPNYTGLADQDFVCRYSDDNLDISYGLGWGRHEEPLYLDIIQTSHAWAVPPAENWILFQFYIIPKKTTLKNIYIGYYWEGTIGQGIQVSGLDDCNDYFADKHLGYGYDTSDRTEDDGVISPIGFKVFPPENIDSESLTWTYNNLVDAVDIGNSATHEEDAYNTLSSGKVFALNCDAADRPYIPMLISFGPIESLAVGDTLHFMVAEVFGQGLEGMLKNVERLEWFKSFDFQSAGPPPKPNFGFKRDNHQVTLQWSPEPGPDNPETWTDDRRQDREIESQPFEGYRVYKSTESINGPWTLLAEYDIADNAFFNNSGLQHEYTDLGLVNNLEYWYTVTSFSKPDTVSKNLSLESSLNANAIEVTAGAAPPQTTGEVVVVPNPYRGDINYNAYKPPWEKPRGGIGRWHESDRRIQFVNIPSPCKIKIYTLAGDLVQTLQHDNPERGFTDWNLTSTTNQTIASGIYLFSVEDSKNGKIQVGKFVIVK